MPAGICAGREGSVPFGHYPYVLPRCQVRRGQERVSIWPDAFTVRDLKTCSDAVAIWGLGPIGLLAARWCQLEGARRIVAIDTVPERLELARTKLGIEVIDFNQVSSVVDKLLEMESYGWDCCIDAAAFRYAKGILHTIERAVGLETDTSEIANECLRAVKKFGHVSLIADYAAFTNHFNIGALMEKGITFRGAGQCPVQFYWKDLLKKLEVSRVQRVVFSSMLIIRCLGWLL